MFRKIYARRRTIGYIALFALTLTASLMFNYNYEFRASNGILGVVSKQNTAKAATMPATPLTDIELVELANTYLMTAESILDTLEAKGTK